MKKLPKHPRRFVAESPSLSTKQAAKTISQMDYHAMGALKPKKGSK